MSNHPNIDALKISEDGEPRLERSYTLNFIGDWGQANFHRICGWLTQEFCDRAGPESRVATWSICRGGIEALPRVQRGEADLSVATPAALMKKALTGETIFQGSPPMTNLRALAVLPQNDRLVLALDPKYGITSYEQLRREKPALRIACSIDDGTNFIGYVSTNFLEAHGISEAELESWGGKLIKDHRPEQCVARVERGEADALLQEAIMTPWWANLVEGGKLKPISAEPAALETLQQKLGMGTNTLPRGFWRNLDEDLLALDFSDFVIVVRDDMPDEVAYLLTWCLVETRAAIERQYLHLPPHRAPLSYPLEPEKMAKPSLPLHPGAEKYYVQNGYL